jgi:hypothetical protein
MGEKMETWETQDMALAVYLRTLGEKTKAEWRDGTCFWKFMDTEAVRREVTKYAQGEALVEPRLFSRTFSISKREMFAAPGSPRKNRSVDFGRASFTIKMNTD